MRLPELQARVRETRQRGLRRAETIDELHLDEARRKLSALVDTVERVGWLPEHERQLATMTRDVAVSAASQMAAAAGEHAADELARIDDGAAKLARDTKLVATPRAELERLAEQMADRIDPLLAASGEPHVDLAAQLYQLERIVQTEGWRAYASQRRAIEQALRLSGFGERACGGDSEQRALDIDGTLIVIAVEWDSWLDRRTCPQCAQRDGAVRPLGMSFPGGLESPPLHPRCRCIAGYWPVPIPV